MQRRQGGGPLDMDGWSALVQLSSRAAVVVAEDMPVNPYARWLQVLPAWLPVYRLSSPGNSAQMGPKEALPSA